MFVLTYVPCQLMLLFSLSRDSAPLELVQILLCIGMMFLFMAARVGAAPEPPERRPMVNLDLPLGILTLAAVTSVVAVNYGHMRIVSFTDVYALRFEASEVGGLSIVLGLALPFEACLND